jgi:hypothetical protein
VANQRGESEKDGEPDETLRCNVDDVDISSSTRKLSKSIIIVKYI